MKICFYSVYGESVWFADLLSKIGHEVSVFVEDERYSLIGKGMGAERIDDFFMSLDRYSKNEVLIVFDTTGKGAMADWLKSKGYMVVGASLFSDRTENERAFATNLAKQFMPIPPTSSFSSFEEGIKFVESQEDSSTRFIFKPDGADTPKDWTYVSKSKNDLLTQMDTYKSQWNTAKKISYQLQEFIEGDECDFGFWMCYQKGVLENSFEWYFEDKKAMAGNLGMAAGCADALEYWTSSKEPYFKKYIEKMIPLLMQNKVNGNVAFNNIYSYKYNKFFFLEDTFRFGGDALQNQIYSLISRGKDPALLLLACATGKPLPSDYFDSSNYQFNVRFNIFPAPKDAPDIAKQYAKGHVVSFDKSIEKHIYLLDAYYNETEKRYECAGSSGILGVMCTSSKTIEGARTDLYNNIAPRLNIADVFYRTDGAKKVEDKIKRLSQVGAILPRA